MIQTHHQDYTTGLRLSKNQERMWLLDKMSANKALYHNSSAIKIEGQLDSEQLQKACLKVIRKHSQLCIYIQEKDGYPYQFYSPHLTDLFSQINLENHPSLIRKTIQDILHTPFNFNTGPLCKFILIKQSSTLHFLVIHLHHIVADGWSKSLILKDLLQFYSIENLELECHIKNDYEDFIREQNSLKIDEQLWQQIFPHQIPLLELPTDHHYPDLPLGHGSIFPFQIPPMMYSEILAFTKEKGITLFTFLMSIYTIVLFNLSGQSEFAVGFPVSGRTKKEWQDVVGLFVNTLSIPINVDPNSCFIDHLLKIQANIFKVLAHQHTPFEDLVKLLNPLRDLRRNPLFQVMIQYDNLPIPPLSLKNLTITPEIIDLGIAQVDLSMTLWPQTNSLHASIEYRTDIFEPSTIEQFSTYFITALENVLMHPLLAIASLNIMPKNEREGILKFNDTSSLLPFSSFISKFESICLTHPKQPVIIFEDRIVTYQDLLADVYQQTHYLQAVKISKESKVAIVLPPSIELISILLSTSLTGAIFTIIDPTYPLQRQKEILESLKPDLVIHSEKNKINSHANFLTIEQISNTKHKYSATTPEISAENDRFCIIFTSGSSGKPKGVVLKHDAIANIVHSFIQSYDVRPHDKILSLSSVSFASFLGEVIPTLCSGATLVLPNQHTIFDHTKLLQFIDQNQITILSTVPSFIRFLNTFHSLPSCLRLLLSGGESLHPQDISNLKQSLKIANGYGLTEGTICSSYEMIDPSSSSHHQKFSLGKPISNSELFILDPFGKLSLTGAVGEICIGGIGLMQEYLDDSILTNQAFTQHPFDPSRKVLLTKDYGIRLASGEIHYLGRKDKQTKIRGYRVNLYEIENKILESNLVEQASVNFLLNRQTLVAVAIPKIDAGFSIKNLQIWLQNNLPRYMLPSDIYILEHLPQNSNGKVDWEKIQNKIDLTPKEKPCLNFRLSLDEEEISKVWKKILNKTEIGLDQNFFDIGGHSLLLSEVLFDLQKKFPGQIEIVDLFRFPTIRSLGEYLRGHSKEKESEEELVARVKKQQEATLHSQKRKVRVYLN